VKNTLEAMAYMANRFYGAPSTKQKVIGITGTNGKTTTAWLVYNILKRGGWPVALFGTIRYLMPDGTEEKASLTTPQSIKWQALLNEAQKKGAKATVAEVSSHGLALKRVDWTSFSVSLFTNLSRDHLDFHKDMEDYFQAKARLFRQWTEGPWVVNIDDPYGSRLASEAGQRLVSYGLSEKAHFRAVQWDLGIDATTALITDGQSSVEIKSPLIGKMNLYNILGAVAVARVLGVAWDMIREAMAETGPVSGRLQKVPTQRGFTVIIDYAHTPDALQKVLEALRPLTQGRLISVFGCGGNRDRGKRPLMGEIASQLSDLIIVTSDNPRWEEPEEIIKDIVEGIKGDNYKVVPDRRQAISEALTEARPGDMVLIAGKGHEDYQEVKGKRFYFSDYDTVMQLLDGSEALRVAGGSSV
jgi:UDP-N-acetylmuramoyl-L-alanyl-D-glutamate--2,6-diaminopimelate ligase